MSSEHKINSILSITQSFNHYDTWNLIEQLTATYRIQSNIIIQQVPREIWVRIIDLFDDKKEIKIYVQLRLVSKTFNDIYIYITQNFTKLTAMIPCDKIFPKLKTLTTNSIYNASTNLTKLNLVKAKPFCGWKLALFTNITTLSIKDSTIYDGDLWHLTHLSTLKLYNITNIIGNCFCYLTNLQTLALFNTHETYNFRLESLKDLSNLKQLKVSPNYKIENEHISHLTNLTVIKIEK
jgi:hypothetical protein